MLAETEAWIATTLAALVIVSAAVALAWVARRQSQAIEAWRRFASERGLAFVAPEVPWYRGRIFRVEGDVRGVSFRIHKEVVRRGKSSRVYTRLHAQGRERTRAAVVVRPNDLAARLNRFFGATTRAVGDAEFDRRLAVGAADGEALDELLHPMLREKLLEFGALTELTLDRDQLTLRWPNLERDPERLQRAIEIAVLVFAPPRPAGAARAH